MILAPTSTSAALRLEALGGTRLDETAMAEPGRGQLLVHVLATGIAPDSRSAESPGRGRTLMPAAWRSGMAGIVQSVGENVAGFAVGDEIFGVTTPPLLHAGDSCACVSAARVAHKPRRTGFGDAAAIPTTGVAAWQMLFAHGRLEAGETVVILGADRPVGLAALQIAHACGVRIIALSSLRHATALRDLGADRVIDARPEYLEAVCARAAVVVDTLGGMIQRRALLALGSGGTVVSTVSRPDASMAAQKNVQCVLCLPIVTTVRLQQLARLIDRGLLDANVLSRLAAQATASSVSMSLAPPGVSAPAIRAPTIAARSRSLTAS
jgi:NADPH:quinone reductase-like Zn-dependent oxidoreductase